MKKISGGEKGKFYQKCLLLKCCFKMSIKFRRFAIKFLTKSRLRTAKMEKNFNFT